MPHQGPSAHPANPPPPSPAAETRVQFHNDALAAAAASTLEMLALAAQAAKDFVATSTPETVARRLPAMLKAHATIVRSLRQTVALDAKLAALEAKAAHTTAAQQTTTHQATRRYIRAVEDAIVTHSKPEARENLLADFYERLDDPDLAPDLLQDLATSDPQQMFAEACYDLGIHAITDRHRIRHPADLAALAQRATAIAAAIAIRAATGPAPRPSG